MKNTKGFTLIEALVAVAIMFIVVGIIWGVASNNEGGKGGLINPRFHPREAQAQALQEQNRLKERELELMEENNRLLRELKNK